MTIQCHLVECHACGRRGRFHACICAHRRALGVGGLPVCQDCENGQRHIAKFLVAITTTMRQERANSARSRLYNSLLRVVSENVRAGAGRQWKDARYMLDQTSGPLDDDTNFRRSVEAAILALPMTRETGEMLRDASLEGDGGAYAFLGEIANGGQRAV